MFKRPAPESVEAPPARRDQLQPRIKHVAFQEALNSAGVPADQRPPTVALCGELLVTYAFDLDDKLMFATPAALARCGVRTDEVGTVALANLQRVLPELQFFAKKGCGVAITGNDLEATLLLVDSVWERMQANFSGEILATVPRRDRILMCDSADPGAVAALREQAAEFFNEIDDSHRLSTQIMVRRHGTWALFDQH